MFKHELIFRALANLSQGGLAYAMRRRIFGRSTERDRSLFKPGNLVVAFAVAAVLAFYAWTVETSLVNWPRVQGQEADYSNLLSHGFLSGHLCLEEKPPLELINAVDPYDPTKRPSVGVADVSYYKSKYYLYWGPAPVLTLFLPFRVISGVDLPQSYGNLFFVGAGFLLSVGIWLSIRRRYFPSSGGAVALLGILVLGVCGMTLSLLRRPSFWELPIAAGYAYAMLGLACLYAGLHARSLGRLGWWLAGSLALGLAVASRPTYAVGAAPLLAVIAWSRARNGEMHTGKTALLSRSGWKEVFVLGTPLVSIVLGLLAYNYERFENPFEFGLRYQLSGAREFNAAHFSMTYAPFNGFIYYLAPAQWSRYFPFIQIIRARSLPNGYYGIEFPYGLLMNLPVCWLALLVPLGLRGRRPGGAGSLAVFLFGLGTFYAGVGLFLLGFWAGTQRYMADFAPSLALLACLGLLAAERMLSTRRWLIRLPGLFTGLGLAAFSVFFCVMASFQLHGILAYFSPQSYDRLARVFNGPTGWFERLSGSVYGPLEFDVRFPKGRVGKLEPLVSTGWEFYSDQVFVYYVDDRHLRLGFDHINHGMRLSDPIEIDFGAIHHLRVELGSLYPPEQHVFYDGKSPLERAFFSRRLNLVLDSRTAVGGAQEFYDASPGSLQIGGTTATKAYGERFTGEISKVRRVQDFSFKEPLGAYGAIALRFGFPNKMATQPQPLVSAGAAGKADLFYVRSVGDGAVRFGYDHSGADVVESEEIALDFNLPHALEVTMPALLPPHPDIGYSVLPERVVVRLDQRLVWQAKVQSYRVNPEEIVVGRNTSGSSGCGPVFGGLLSEIERNPAMQEPLRRSAGHVSLQLIFPSNRTGQSEPLFARGVTGAADMLLVRYRDANHLSFALDHWGFALTESEPIAVESGREYALEARFEESREAGPSRLVLLLDHREIWTTAATFHPAAAESVTVGLNRLGASACGPIFTGAVLQIEFPHD